MAGPARLNGVNLQIKGLASTRSSEANHANLAKAFRAILDLGSHDTMVLQIDLVGATTSNIGQFDISGLVSTRAMRPVLQECGLI